MPMRSFCNHHFFRQVKLSSQNESVHSRFEELLDRLLESFEKSCIVYSLVCGHVESLGLANTFEVLYC